MRSFRIHLGLTSEDVKTSLHLLLHTIFLLHESQLTFDYSTGTQCSFTPIVQIRLENLKITTRHKEIRIARLNLWDPF